MATLRVSVVSADRELWSGEASIVVARTTEGEMGILPGHEPVLAILAPGEVAVTPTDGDKVRVRANDGFLSVQSNVVTIVSGDAELL